MTTAEPATSSACCTAPGAASLAATLNDACLCTTLQEPLVDAGLLAARPTLFSRTPVFLTAGQHAAITEGVAALHRATRLPGYQAHVLARSGLPPVAGGPSGAFMGYDFHLGAEGPRLIEVNTNAGGAFLHAAALAAHRACCSPVDRLLGFAPDPAGFEDAVLEMFTAEWQAAGRTGRPRTVAIVDDDPAGQYLAPEFELARQVFERHGIAAVVADPSELAWDGQHLRHPGLPAGGVVDLVYNRITDFALADPRHAVLRQAWEQAAAVVTPDPTAHALQADKRNLVLFGDTARLVGWGLAPSDARRLDAVVPRTQLVDAANADALWADRRHWFFKPACGFGSRGAYRGDKLTRRVWGEITAGGYVAQELVTPSERAVQVDGEVRRLKVDIRAYAYQGRVLLLAARLYAGQTTNFRTPGGGFAPVTVLPDLGD